MIQSARGSRQGAFAKDKREFELDKIAQSSARIPGPAEYTAVSSNKGKGPVMQAKREIKIADTPGPG